MSDSFLQHGEPKTQVCPTLTPDWTCLIKEKLPKANVKSNKSNMSLFIRDPCFRYLKSNVNKCLNCVEGVLRKSVLCPRA